MPYLSQNELEALGLKALGKNVKISTRAAIYDADRIEIGDYSRIDDFCVISGRVVLGRNVFIGAQSMLAGGVHGVFLDDFCGLSYGVRIFSQTDDYSGKHMSNPTVPLRYKKETKIPVRLGRHCIVGTGATIFPGTTVAEGTAVGAMTLITKSTQPWSVYFGVPARRLRSRSRDLLELEKLYLAEERG